MSLRHKWNLGQLRGEKQDYSVSVSLYFFFFVVYLPKNVKFSKIYNDKKKDINVQWSNNSNKKDKE